MRVGEFLVNNGIITGKLLKDALDMQKDNPSRLIGEILVTMGALSKEQLIMALEMYLMETDVNPGHVDEWLDQDEVDMMIEKIKKKKYPAWNNKVIDKRAIVFSNCPHD